MSLFLTGQSILELLTFLILILLLLLYLLLFNFNLKLKRFVPNGPARPSLHIYRPAGFSPSGHLASAFQATLDELSSNRYSTAIALLKPKLSISMLTGIQNKLHLADLP